MELIHLVIDWVLHLDQHLAQIISQYGIWTYGILFTVIFCETGLVVTPFLPGDSLLFAVGALSATGALNPHFSFLLLVSASVLGDNTNYTIGRFIGPRAFSGQYNFLKREYLTRTQEFYTKYGRNTVIFGRFLPIIRTFAPFVAGVAQMNRFQYVPFTVLGAILWVGLFLYAGYFFGNIQFVKHNFAVVIIAIIMISAIPAIIEVVRHRISSTK